MTNLEFLREKILKDCGVIQPPAFDLEELKKTQWSDEFEKLMRNRLLFGAFRYAPLPSQKKGAYDNLGSIEKRLNTYRKTGNDELLVDIANICLVEFVNGAHPHKHFKSEDDGEHVKEMKFIDTAKGQVVKVVEV